jgi:hypothetical protein
MKISCRKGIFFALGLLLLQNAIAEKPREVFHRSFWQPYYHGERLAYCALDRKCGLPVATRYCQMMGYARADQQIIANNVGLTNYLATNVPCKGPLHPQCKGWRCNGFKTIRCAGTIKHKPPKPYHYQLRRYVYPRYNHYRVDWCYDGKTRCGQRVAYSFCRRMGYMQARSYIIQKHVKATQAIGNQKLCFGNECNGFAEINCSR